MVATITYTIKGKNGHLQGFFSDKDALSLIKHLLKERPALHLFVEISEGE